MQDKVGSHLIEKVVEFASDEDFQSFYTNEVEPRFLYLCKDNVANFVVQRVIQKIQGEQQVKSIVRLAAPEFEKLICIIF
jgi:nucleolar protein 9